MTKILFLCTKPQHSIITFSAQACTKWYNIPPEVRHNFVQYNRHNGLLSAAEYGNMSDTKEATA